VTTPHDRHALGDPRIPWVVLLDLSWTAPPPVPDLAAGLSSLAAEGGWAAPGPGAVVQGERRQLLSDLSTASPEALRLGRYDAGVVLAARHDALDGLAMLTAARRLLGQVRSSARGLPPDSARASSRSTGRELGRRAWEVLVRPPARVAPSRSDGASGDVFASTTVPFTVRTADLVHSGARALADWNAEHGRPAARTAVAIGASTIGGSADLLRDSSAFLRLTGVESMSLDQVRAAIAAAPVQPGGESASASGVLGRAVGVALRVAAPRLGSTLLVSHLGTLSGDDHLAAAAFYPVTGGGSGLSLGAATVVMTTTITVRARAAQHDDDALQHLLERVVAYLD